MQRTAMKATASGKARSTFVLAVGRRKGRYVTLSAMNELVPKTTSRTVALSVSDKAIVPDFYSGATGLSGRFSEGFLLRRFQASVCKRPV